MVPSDASRSLPAFPLDIGSWQGTFNWGQFQTFACGSRWLCHPMMLRPAHLRSKSADPEYPPP